MSVYRRKSSNGKRSRFLTAEFTYRGKKHIRSGFVDRESAKLWLNTEILRLRRSAVGYIKPMLAAKAMPLIAAFADHLRTRGRDDMYAYIVEKRLERLAGDCGWVTIGNATRESLSKWVEGTHNAQAGRNRGKPISKRTKNQYLDTALDWGAWLASADVSKLPANPFAGLDRVPAKHNDDYRRPGTIEELNKLLATCSKERRLYYIFRIYTPMRGKTIARLTWRMMHLDADHPFAETPAEFNKSRKPEKHPVRFQVAQELRTLRKASKAKADDVVFPDAPTLDDYRIDLKAAGVEFDRGGNHRLDYHALRTTLVQIGKQAGLTAFQMMDLIGWKSMATMMKHYSKQSIEPDRAESMAKLPTLGTVRRAQ